MIFLFDFWFRNVMIFMEVACFSFLTTFKSKIHFSYQIFSLMLAFWKVKIQFVHHSVNKIWLTSFPQRYSFYDWDTADSFSIVRNESQKICILTKYKYNLVFICGINIFFIFLEIRLLLILSMVFSVSKL